VTPYVYDDASLRAHPLCVDATADTAAAYFADVAARLCRFPSQNPSSFQGLKIVYTPMHGVGHRFAARAFEAFHLPPYHAVACQQEPDPEFPVRCCAAMPAKLLSNTMLVLYMLCKRLWILSTCKFALSLGPACRVQTVRFPNPEEKGALSEACKLADEIGADLVIANDPVREIRHA
jgi:phosphomannomutase